MSVHIPSHGGSHSASPWTPLRAAIGTFAAAVVVFGLGFQFVSAVVFIAAGGLALGAGAGVLGAVRALKSSLSRDAMPPPLASFAAIFLIVGVTFGGLGTLRFVTLPGTPPRVAGVVPNPFASQPPTTATPAPATTPAATPTAADTPTPTSSPGPSSSPTAAPRTVTALPYHADWSKGLAGWAVTSNWQLVDGVLTNDGKAGDNKISATAPLDLTSTRDYVVEGDFDLVRYGDYNSGSFGFVVRSSDDLTGYRVGHCSNGGFSGCDYNTYVAGIWEAGRGNGLVHAEFKPPPQSWHHYKVEVKATTITFTVADLGVNLTTTDNAYLTGTEVGLWARGCQVSVKNFTVSAAP